MFGTTGPMAGCLLALLGSQILGAARAGGGEPVEFFGPFNATVQDTFDALVTGPSGHILTAFGPGEVLITYTTRRARVGRSSDGAFTWPGSVDIDEFTDPDELSPPRASSISGPVRLGDGLAVLWGGTPSLAESERMYFTRLGPTGHPTAPRVVVEPPHTSPFRGVDLPQLAAFGDRLAGVWRADVPEEPTFTSAIRWSLSDDGGTSWSLPRDLVRISELIAPALAVSPDGTFYACVTQQAGPSVHFFRRSHEDDDWQRPPGGGPPISLLYGMPSLAVHPDGTVGLALVVYDPSYSELMTWFLTSADRGDTWSAPVVFDPTGPSEIDIEPALAVDARGVWHLAWRSGVGFAIDVYYARSLDPAGTTWSAPLRVNPVPGSIAPQTPRTVSLAADAEGHVYVSYVVGDISGEAIHVMTTRERPYDGYDDLSFFSVSVAPNPFRSSTTLRLSTPGPASAGLVVYDVSGRRMQSWRDLELSRGPNAVTWDGRRANGMDVPAGVYYWEASIESANAGPVTRRGRIVRVAE